MLRRSGFAACDTEPQQKTPQGFALRGFFASICYIFNS
jgi:hypothetical protein